MLRIGMIVVLIFLTFEITLAQEVGPPVPVDTAKEIGMLPRATGEAGQGKLPFYTIEMRILEERSAEETALRNKGRRSTRSRTGNAAGAYVPNTIRAAPTAKPARMAPPARPAEARAPEEPDLWDDSLNDPGVSVLAAPVVSVVAGVPAMVQVKSEAVLTYLEPLGNGKFEAKETRPRELGMEIELAIQPIAGNDQYVDVSPLQFRISTLDGREPVDGLNLEAGKPIIAKRSLNTTARLKLGIARRIAIPSGPKAEAALLLRVTRMDPEESK